MTGLAVTLAALLAIVVASAALPVGAAPHATSLAAPGPALLPLPASLATDRRLPVDVRHLVGGNQGRLLVTTGDPLAMPNDGLRFNASPFTEPPLGSDASFQASVEETIGGYDAVFGLFTNSATAPIPFFSVFSNTTDITEHLAYWPNASAGPTASYDFELVRANGTLWQLDVNGALFGANASAGTFDFGATQATWLAGLSFSEIALYSTMSSAPAFFSASLAFGVLLTSGWYLPVDAAATFSPPGGASWGIEGRLQHPTLAPGEIVSGTSIAAVANGTELWSGGPVPVQVELTAPPGSQSLTAVAVSATVTTPSGVPVPGATVYFYDSLRGNFTPSSVGTGPDGSATGAYIAPSITANTTDLLTATVTTFGFTGYTEVSVALEPAVQVIVRSLTASPTVGPAGSIVLTFSAARTGGAPLEDVYLAFGTSGGVISPTFGLTGADGRIATTLQAPNATGYVLVRAVVASGGEWGEASVNVSVRPPGPGLLTPAEVDGAVIAGLVVVAAAVVILLRRRAARRPPVPPMRLPRAPKLPPRPADAVPPPPATRTPPGPDAP
jgi:hypothetical protein